VARGLADLVEVVVLAAGAHALLTRGGPLHRPALAAGEDVLELHHPGVGEQEGGVVLGHQRRGADALVPSLGEEVEENGPDLVGFHDPGKLPELQRCGAIQKSSPAVA
jgi:hypothetical protein